MEILATKDSKSSWIALLTSFCSLRIAPIYSLLSWTFFSNVSIANFLWHTLKDIFKAIELNTYLIQLYKRYVSITQRKMILKWQIF